LNFGEVRESTEWRAGNAVISKSQQQPSPCGELEIDSSANEPTIESVPHELVATATCFEEWLSAVPRPASPAEEDGVDRVALFTTAVLLGEVTTPKAERKGTSQTAFQLERDRRSAPNGVLIDSAGSNGDQELPSLASVGALRPARIAIMTHAARTKLFIDRPRW
jgi:hypothetical protein